ncbi:MAG: hypothetical protein Q9160_002613 [Pyrenula sp. 1 TL-2023]
MLLSLLVGLALALRTTNALQNTKRQLNVTAPIQEAAASREYFYVGGEYVSDNMGGHVYQGQMYVERLTSAASPRKPYPIVFIHGLGQTATNWLNRPDGTPGWASYFLTRGYDIYLVDQPIRGRSPLNIRNPNTSTPALSVNSAETVARTFTAPEKFNLWPQASLHTQWPQDSSEAGTPYFDAFYASQVPSLTSAALQQSYTVIATLQLLSSSSGTGGTGPAILLSHSAGGPIPWLVADARPDLVAGIVALEPAGPPFFSVLIQTGPARAYGVADLPLTYEPAITTADELTRAVIPAPAGTRDLIQNCTVQAEPARRLTRLEGIPVGVVTSEASYHAPYDWCTVAYLRQAGVNVTHLQLPEVGVHGNGHMMFLEKNSDEVAEKVEGWIVGAGVGGSN